LDGLQGLLNIVILNLYTRVSGGIRYFQQLFGMTV
jgi:hypothetical protein